MVPLSPNVPFHWSSVIGCGAGAGLSATTLASQGLEELKNHVHSGSTVPELPWMAKAGPPLRLASDCTKLLYPAGASSPPAAFDRVVAYTCAPELTAIAPALALVVLDPVPDADSCAPSACTVTDATPVYAEIARPPLTEVDRFARTARMLS